MIWLALLLTASLAAPSVASGDGQPPVTIIEIPVATTTTAATPTTVVAPESSVQTSSPGPARTSPPNVEEVSSPTRWSFRSWVALLLVVAGVVLVAILRRLPRKLFDADATPAVALPETPETAPLASGAYEAVEYRSEIGSSEVQPRTLGEFTTLEAAIDAARIARSWFILNSPTEAFWVVWNVHSKRAAWIAESSTPGESVIDLRTGRRQPYTEETART